MRIVRDWLSSVNWFWVLAGLLLGGIIHISAIFALPYLASSSAWARLEGVTPLNAPRILPPTSPELQILPLMAPDIRYALCRYDLAEGSMILRAPLLDRSWSIALYTPLSLNFYAISGADLQRSNVTIILTQSKEGEGANIPLVKGAKTSVITVAVPEPNGLLILRAPIKSQAYKSIIEAALANFSCETAKNDPTYTN